MAPIEFDFADEANWSKFPSHGKALNSQGYMILWLPIVRLLKTTAAMRESMQLSIISSSDIQEISAFKGTLQLLILNLRELHAQLSIVKSTSSTLYEMGKRDPRTHAETFNQHQIAHQMIPLFLDHAYVLLRRLPDRFTAASRYRLFDDYKQAPVTFDKLLREHTTGDLAKYGIVCDDLRLKQTLEQHSNWYQFIKPQQSQANGRKSRHKRLGVRDALEHRQVNILTSLGKINGEDWEIIASLGQLDTEEYWQEDLVNQIKYILDDMCSFWAGICRACELVPPAQQTKFQTGDSDCWLEAGDEHDVTGFWPQL